MDIMLLYLRIFLFIFGISYPVHGAVFTSFDFLPKKAQRTSDIELRAALTRDNRYTLWPNPTAIPYRLDPTYTAAEQSIITQAMSAISSGLSGCIGFVPYSAATTGQDHIAIFKTMNDGSTPLTCFSFPGRYAIQSGRGQKLGMFTGTNGCLGSVRDAMKFLFHALGIRNEYDRPDRDTYILVTKQNLRPELSSLADKLFVAYTATQVDYLNTDFDFNSITFPNPAKYANDGTTMFTSRTARNFGTLPQLSLGDCQAAALLYSTCRMQSCTDPYNTGTVTVGPIQPTLGPVQPTLGPVQPTSGPIQPVIPGVPVTAAPVTAAPTTASPINPVNPIQPDNPINPLTPGGGGVVEPPIEPGGIII